MSENTLFTNIEASKWNGKFSIRRAKRILKSLKLLRKDQLERNAFFQFSLIGV